MALTSDEKDALHTAAEATMLDTCKLGTLTEQVWGSAPGSRAWAYGSAIACGVGPQRSMAEAGNGAEVTITEVEIRLPHGTDVSGASRIQVTHRTGDELDTPEIYTITGAPHQGMTALVCKCQRVIGESRQ